MALEELTAHSSASSSEMRLRSMTLQWLFIRVSPFHPGRVLSVQPNKSNEFLNLVAKHLDREQESRYLNKGVLLL